MKKWHENPAADAGLRTGGLALLGLGWPLAARLHQLALAVPAREAPPFMLLLAAALFLCASAGSALLFAGAGLWETVEVSERWRRLPPPDAGSAVRRAPREHY